ncbi:MAG: phospho-N-acetylmuramoyl-pentapeptide-transferase [Thermomicrobiales bacterium]|nr:phospho-N-acetylmuramoyl-pentapeptide-transferase [Thermomicrobiales bacterium]
MIEQSTVGQLNLGVLVTSVMPTDPNQNMAVSLALASLAFLVTVLIGRPIVTLLRVKKAGKQIRKEGPASHIVKMGVPTMGGIMVSTTVVILTVVFNLAGRLSMLLPIGILLASAILGALDDRQSFVGAKQHGMSARRKILWQTGIAAVAGLILYLPDPYGLGLHHIYVPFRGSYSIGILYLPIAILTIIAMSNAVNITDGLDSLAGGLSAIAFVAYGVIAYQQGQVGVVTFSFTMVGSLLGFLWFNAHPAQVIMGDTGSLMLGATLAVSAFMTGQWLLLPVVGAVFVAEIVSVILQVSYFKWTGGKRIFKMTPLHHHFEEKEDGWSETQVTLRFWIVGMMFGLIGVAFALL